MQHDKLFIIQADFADGEPNQNFYCPGCAEILGLFKYYPQLESKVEICYVPFQRPRPSIVDLIGADNQGCPVLVLAPGSTSANSAAQLQNAGGHYFTNDLREIGIYLSETYGIGFPYPPKA
ncbi:DUF3088 family protein [Pelagicoccus sp. SDUM812005]|uniref:DUF3088 family protein n=1 Tax=Pelagicoccus sp. SDUM812005 TaxID=3041257 RepID=UPI002810BE1F|nr:DUF3088 family protein [Pelagicoccus sp. SDUM812005]